uniref:Keratin, type II cytoskeletal 8 n=1 Tax=Microcebus murinus TaxID=30608 RepID=A0A8C5YHA4_MICMU
MSPYGPWAFSSCSYTSGPSAHISSSSFSWVGSSSGFQSGLGMCLGGGYAGASGMGGITAVRVNQNLLSFLILEVDPNIQAMCNQEEEIKTLNDKFASFINKVRFLEQQNKMLETKWSLLQHNLLRQLDTLGQEKLKLEAELGNMQGLVENFKNKYEDEINKRTEMENEFVLIKKDVDEAYMNKVELESRLEGLTDEINFLRQLHEEEICELQSQMSDTSVVLIRSWRFWLGSMGMTYGFTAGECSPEVKAKRASLETVIADAEQCGNLAITGAMAKVDELNAALQRAKQGMAWQLRKYQELMNVKLALDFEITTYHKLLGGEESQLESGMQSMSIHTKTTSGYSGGLSSAYRGLISPGLSCGLSFFQPCFGSGGSSGSFSCISSSRAVVVKKIKICEGKLVSKFSDVLPK